MKIYVIWRETRHAGYSGLHNTIFYASKDAAIAESRRLNTKEQEYVDNGYVGNARFLYLVVEGTLIQGELPCLSGS